MCNVQRTISLGFTDKQVPEGQHVEESRESNLIMSFECDVNVLGKFFALQSLLHAAPDEKWLGNVLCRGAVDLPGLSTVALYLDGEHVAHSSSPSFPVQWPQTCPDDPASLNFSSVTTVRSFFLCTPRKNFGYFFIAIVQPDKFNPYLAHLENTLSLVSLVLETKHQNVLLKESAAALKSQVVERTDTLKERERHIRLLLDSAAEGIYGLDERGNCTFCNRSCIEMLGCHSEEDLLGKNMHELIHHTRHDGSSYPVNECNIYHSFRSGENIHSENEVLWKADGTSFAAEYWSHPILDDGRAIGAVVTFLDISARKDAERELLLNQQQLIESENKFRTLYLESPLPYHSLNEQGDFMAVNPAWLNLLGYEEADVLGRNYGELLHPDWKAVFAAKFPLFKQYGTVKDVYFKIRHKNGHYLDISLDGCISTNTDGSFNRTNCVFSDITDQKRLESEQVFLKRRLEALWNVSRLINEDLKTISTHILEEIVEMTSSPYGFYGFMNNAEDELGLSRP